MADDKMTQAYDEATQQLTGLVRQWLDRLENPFVAPELKTGLPTDVGSACFKQAAIYYALCNYG